MEFTAYDFLIGFFLMNAMPHMLFGLYRIRFLSLFGFSAPANLGYALVNAAASLALFAAGGGQAQAAGVLVGAGAVLVAYLVTGKFFYRKFHIEGGGQHEQAGHFGG